VTVSGKQGVNQGLILKSLVAQGIYQGFCGQGRGRTADLPIFSRPVTSSAGHSCPHSRWST